MFHLQLKPTGSGRLAPVVKGAGIAWLAGGIMFASAQRCAQAEGAEQPATAVAEEASSDNLDAAEADGEAPRRKLVGWNEYEGPYFTARLGAGFLYDYAGYAQDDDSKQQLALGPAGVVRDFRFLLKGRLKFSSRLSYSIGYMYDVAAKTWRFRQTGIMIGVPEAWGSVFIGRTKEGFSTNKLMVGYHGWTTERSTANDAFLPILADGVKWTGTIPSGKFVYNLGWFNDTRSENESFNKNDKQFAARAVWLPFAKTDRSLLHLALEARYGEADDGQFRYRSKPESFPAQQYAIDTGKFAASHSNMIGVEAYYRPGPLMFGMEYFLNKVSSREAGDPLFHGGEIFAAYLLTGETRPYNARGAFFEAISPARPVFSGGPGAWEVVLRLSYTDLDSGPIQGGTFWRLTPMVNWHLSDNVRFELSYGYGVLDKSGIKGGTQFLQTRLQLTL
jgi:phosphate-selective porin OprO/OprP